MDLLRYQVDELAEANLQDADEDERLEAEEDALADVAAHREAALQALDAKDDGARDVVGGRGGLTARAPFRSPHERLLKLGVGFRRHRRRAAGRAEALDEDPARLRMSVPAGSSCTSYGGSTATRWPTSWPTKPRPRRG